jgi:NAD(P)-dependent dehydrogenase (short-subunit alcohol dehydrogenase family)
MESRVALITGGSSGIGKAISQFLLKKGCVVYATGRSFNNGDLLDGVKMLYLDLSKPESIKAAVDYVIEKEGTIDVLVNNAGMGMAGAVEDATTEEIAQLFQANVFGLLECCRAVIPHMRAKKKGWIINMSSLAGEFGLPFRGVYSASKSAVDRFSETLRMELKPWNIGVSIIQPGDFKTNINNNRLVAKKGFTEESPYFKVFPKMYKNMSDDVAHAKNPELVAKVVWKIMSEDMPKMRYPCATPFQRASLSLNRVLPTHLFQKLLLKVYPVE